MSSRTTDSRLGPDGTDHTGANDCAPAGFGLHELILDNCLDAIVAHTPDGVLLYANTEALRQWKCASFAEIVAKGPWGWVPEEQRTKVANRLEQLPVGGEARFDSVGRSGCGAQHAAEVHARCIDGPQGRVIVSVIRDISSRMRTEEMVRYLAYHDSLTGLANRALLDQEVAHALAAADRHDDDVGLAFIDLDDFKPVNDNFGHANGDYALRKVAGRISSCVRLTDTAARIGGDEFVVLLPRLKSADDLSSIAHKIASEISRPMQIGDATVTITPSMGLAVYERGEPSESFIARADHAMYESRKSGLPGWAATIG